MNLTSEPHDVLQSLQCFCGSTDCPPDFHTALEHIHKVIKEHTWKTFQNTHTLTCASHQGSNPARYHQWKNKHELILLNVKSNRGCQQLHYPSNPVQTASVKPNGLADLAKKLLLRFSAACRFPLGCYERTLPLTGIKAYGFIPSSFCFSARDCIPVKADVSV